MFSLTFIIFQIFSNFVNVQQIIKRPSFLIFRKTGAPGLRPPGICQPPPPFADVTPDVKTPSRLTLSDVPLTPEADLLNARRYHRQVVFYQDYDEAESKLAGEFIQDPPNTAKGECLYCLECFPKVAGEPLFKAMKMAQRSMRERRPPGKEMLVKIASTMTEEAHRFPELCRSLPPLVGPFAQLMAARLLPESLMSHYTATASVASPTAFNAANLDSRTCTLSDKEQFRDRERVTQPLSSLDSTAVTSGFSLEKPTPPLAKPTCTDNLMQDEVAFTVS